MFTNGGVGVDAFVKLEAGGYATCVVVAEEAQFRFGGAHSSGLTLVLNESGLEDLVPLATDALRKMRAQKCDNHTQNPVA